MEMEVEMESNSTPGSQKQNYGNWLVRSATKKILLFIRSVCPRHHFDRLLPTRASLTKKRMTMTKKAKKTLRMMARRHLRLCPLHWPALTIQCSILPYLLSIEAMSSLR